MNKENKTSNRVISIILCLAILLPSIPFMYFHTNAASSNGTDPATDTEVVFIDGVDYAVSRTTRYIGNRTYSVQIDISADLSTFEHTRVRTASENGYITIQETGYYLLELWGGRGGDGQMGWTVALIPVPTPGGSGGSGGYVYGKVFLKEGQTLVYNIGTNGDESVRYDDAGGGVNGDGGTHGDMGSYTVGGGGGYSAVYLFEEGEFNESYVTQSAVNIPETARLSRYLMIAGGGGGGGAGFTNLLSNGTASSPNGGAGGNIGNGVSVSLLGDEYDVPGYVFSGRNGFSSGTSNAYIGRGGTNVPGQITSTLMGYYEQTQLPNDWTGTHTSTSDPGAGGSGNFRGGGGGSGYAGGSGGLMTAQLIAANVGGGGGGSSFVADEVNGKKIEFLELKEAETMYLSGANNQPEGQSTGGAIQITYLSGEEDQFYQEALDAITLSATVSKYFDVLTSSKTTGDEIETAVNSEGKTTVTVNALSITPSSPAHSGKTASVTLYLRAKDDFMGGNSVPLISGIAVDFKSPNDNETPVNITPEEKTALRLVNVPLNAKVRTNSYTSSQEGKSYLVTSLYEDDYADCRSDLSSYWQYDYISEISPYSVYQNDTLITASSVAPTETTTYEVRYTVTPKEKADPEVTVGPAVEDPTTITGKAVISVVAPGVAELNGLTVTGTKTLSYADGVYTFSTIIDQESESLTIGGETTIIGIDDNPEWTAPADGWYYVQAWGGNGGGTSAATIYNNYLSPAKTYSASGASGGTGGYVSTYVYFNEGDIVSTIIGAAGSSGGTGSNGGSYNSNSSSSKDTNVSAFSYGGTGGKSTSVMFGNVTVVVAGGGGGAGGGAVLGRTAGSLLQFDRTQRNNAVSGRDSTTVNVGTEPSGSYNGSSGGNGSASWGGSNYFSSRSISAGSAGSAGASFINSNYGTTQNGYTLSTAAQKYAQETIDDTKSGTNGQVAITLIENAAMVETMETVKGINTKVAFSRYFNVDAIDLDVGTSYSSKNVVENDDGSVTVTYTSSSYGQIAQFTYKIEETSDGSSVVTIYDCDYSLDGVYSDSGDGTYSLYYTAHLNFSYSLTPKNGFLGGNDVPVLAYGQYSEENAGLTGGVADKDSLPDCSVRITQGEEFMNLPAADPTDFANVEYTPDMLSYLSVQDKTIHLGESINISELYTFTPPTYAEDDWEDDYAYFIYPADSTVAPTQTTEYSITVGFAPRITEDLKATIVEGLSQQDYSLTATVYVEVPVETSLTNLTCDNEEWTLWGEYFACTLTPNSGYLLPDNVTVTIGGVEAENYTYNSTTGSLSIEGEYVTDKIEITAKAQVKTYEIHILYTNYDEETGTDVMQEEIVFTGIAADEEIDWSEFEKIEINPKVGYDYQWVYETSDGARPETMPANNLWVYGSYVKASYELTIHYKYQDGTEAASDSVTDVTYGDNYTVVSPIIDSYKADILVVSGVMGAEAKEITVTYTLSENELIIIYQKADGTLIDINDMGDIEGIENKANPLVITLTELGVDEKYTVKSPVVVGYTVDKEIVEKTMSEDNKSETVIVTYTPNTYKVTFDYTFGGYDGATLDGEATKLVEYDNIYGFNAGDLEEGVSHYDGLPTPQIVGYTFVGWYLDSDYSDGSLVDESTIVKITEDTVLYAKWSTTELKLTVRYEFLYEDGDYIPEDYESVEAVRGVLSDHVVTVAYGDDYSIGLPSFVGYSAYSNFGLNDQEKITTLTGKMPGQNKLVIITYEINTYEIKFMDHEGEHVTYFYGDKSTVAKDSFNTVWKTVYVKHGVSPVYEESDVDPNHDTRAEYTYTFKGWYGSDDSVTYEGKTPNFPTATKDTEYHAMYEATENIVSVTYGSNVEYFTNVADALKCAETNISSGVVMDFRRNTGNERVLNLNDDTLVFGNTYTGTANYTVTIDLNGIALQNTKGQSVVENTLRPLTIVIGDSGAGGKISVTGDGDVIAIQSTTGSLTVNDQISVDVTSNNGDATGIKFGNATNSYTLSYADELSSVNVTAVNGTACGIDVVGTSIVKPAAVNVTGKDAVGIRTNDGTTLTLSDTVMALNVSGTENATGIRIAEGTSLVNTVSNTKEQKEQIVTSQGDAYGIYNEGTLSSLNLKVTVTGVNNAYGLYNKAGTVTVTGIGSGVDLRATSKNGYGLYNEKDGTAIGSADGDKLNMGAFAGSSYGIYSADNSIFASGNFVYFKGADEEAALEGVVYDNDLYDEIDAKEQFEDGYYRLATLQTITFETNGGTAISSITLYFGVLLPTNLTTTKTGYTFDGWCEDEALQQSSQIPERMPDKDLTLYAKWSLNTYQYALDKQFKEITVKFYKTDPTAPTDTTKMVLLHEQKLTMDDNILDVPNEELTYANGSVLYVHSGWYKSMTTSQENCVILNGDIAQYAEANGELILYSGWQSLSSMQSYVEIGTSSVGCTVDASYSSYYYMYFSVPADGNYTLYYRNDGSSSSTGDRRYITVTRYYNSNGSKYSTDLKARGYVKGSTSYSSLSMSNLQAGDVIVLRAERYSSSYTNETYDTTVYAYVSSTDVDLTAVKDYKAISEVKITPIDYTVEMGTVSLPIADNTGHEDKKFAGWAENAESTRIMQITPDMVDTVEQWQNGELWQLYSQWDERTWAAYQSDKRDFTSFENTDQVNILGNDTVSVRFESEQEPTEALTFKFANGLPAGTILTLIDRSGYVPVYYTYTTTEEVTELGSTLFVKMGTATESFDGFSTDVVLQICYQYAELTNTSETVSIFAGDIVSEVDAVYGITTMRTLTDSNDSVSFTYSEKHTLDVTVPELSGLGLNEEDKVLLRVRWDGVNLAPGSVISLNGMNATIYDGEYALLDTGFTVEEMTAEMSATMSIYLPTMVQNEFESKTFYYELCIAPNADAAFGLQVHPLFVVTEEVTLLETASLTVTADVQYTVSQGGSIAIENIVTSDLEATDSVEIYLYQMDKDYRLVYSEACGKVFDSISVDTDCKLAIDGDGELISEEGKFEATISQTASTGRYYLVFKYGDKYEQILLIVTEASS